MKELQMVVTTATNTTGAPGNVNTAILLFDHSFVNLFLARLPQWAQ